MATDAMEWNQNDWETYARLLNVEDDDICQRDMPFVNAADRRQQYFADLPGGRDLFLDPDTGIAINGMQRTKKHVTIPELKGLLGDSKEHLLMVYQHAAQGKKPQDRFTKIAAILKMNIDECHVWAYECRQVAMFFISRDKGRIQAIESALREYLGRVSKERVRQA